MKKHKKAAPAVARTHSRKSEIDPMNVATFVIVAVFSGVIGYVIGQASVMAR